MARDDHSPVTGWRLMGEGMTAEHISFTALRFSFMIACGVCACFGMLLTELQRVKSVEGDRQSHTCPKQWLEPAADSDLFRNGSFISR
jgi:hypothetical protein